MYFTFRSSALFSDEFILSQPKTDNPELFKKKKKKVRAAHFAGNIKICAYEIMLELHFYDL